MKVALFVCRECGAESTKWLGRCPSCQQWNSLSESTQPRRADRKKVAPGASAESLQELRQHTEPGRRPTGIQPLDRVLGGGIVPGMGILIGGDPGIGKSTLLLQVAAALGSPESPLLYATGEESGEQVSTRAQRLQLDSKHVLLLAENSLERVLAVAEEVRAGTVIADSIQTFICDDLDSPAGSIAQVRESTARLLNFGKRRGVTTFIIGHVTKDGSLAGPKALEHLVDTVIYFEGEGTFAHRILRAVKNRFGPSGEIGVFEMTDRGLAPVANPSSLFLAHRHSGTAGSVVSCSLEGSIPILVEIQALVTGSGHGISRRHSTGLDPGRAALLIAILEKRAGLSLSREDIFLNVSGGIRLNEPAADLPAACAVASSFLNKVPQRDTVVFGEVGLAGEVRGVGRASQRIQEAGRMGFRRCLLPLANIPLSPLEDEMDLVGVSSIVEAVEWLL